MSPIDPLDPPAPQPLEGEENLGPDLEAPTAPAPLQKQPGIILGLLGALLAGIITISGAGGLNDGLQWGDLPVILTPDLMAPREVQQRAVRRRKQS
jgi:hypothetical protein